MTFDDFIRIIPKIKETEIDSNLSHLKMAPPFRKYLLELTKTNYYNSKKAGVSILFHPNNNKVYFTLILRNEYKGVHSNQIGLPGGRFENKDKDIFQTALRETNEETGISEIEFVDGFKEEIEYYFFADNQEIHKRVVFFLGKTKTTEITLSHEHLDYIWLKFDDALNKTTYENAKNLLKKSKEFLDK